MTQGIILSSYFLGFVVGHFPAGYLCERYGGKHIVGIGIFVQGILSYFTPEILELGGIYALICVRIIMGLLAGTKYPGLSVMLSQWACPNEKAKLGGFVYAGTIFGVVVSISGTSYIIKYSSDGWINAFKFFGCTGIVWFPLWTLLCYNTPDDHPFISDTEKELLKNTLQARRPSKSAPSAPWGRILMSLPSWAYVLAMVGYDYIYFTLATDLPKYMREVVKFSIEENGYLSALPYFFMLANIAFSSWINDWLIEKKILGVTNTRKIFSTISLIGPGILIVSASYAECDHTMVVILFVIGMTLMGSAYSSIYVNNLDLSPNYSGTLSALGNALAALGGLLAPYIIGLLTPHQGLSEWRIAFWIIFFVAASTNIFYLIFGSGKIQKWNDLVD